MTLDETTAFLATKGHYLSSLSKLAPELGYMAATRPLKPPHRTADGETGFGQTPQLALDALVRQFGGKPKARGFAEFEAAATELVATLRRINP